ncbi:MAG: Cof-type HAD-IIB family hydrolase [Prevotella sp.]|nr:Cof-type HAD-IIB family hydrolase [Alistipes senegalensis]MCM1358815.1 Cof-type HAD-IIB family hydrolase [Prevotella sp.]MCM1473725.1 Cof-type HAD-IIB family hydrolase [Muribaculaceae bacterium]
MIIIKRLYITDLDGTLLNSKGEVSGNTGKIINSLTEKGIYFTFATARSVYSAKSITAGLNINIPYILMNGVSIYNPENNTYVKNEYIPPEISSEIIRVFRENNVRCFMYRIQDNILTAYFTEITSQVMESFAESRKKNYNKPFVQCADLADIADSKTIYFNTTGEYEEILSVKNSIGNIKDINYAFYCDTYTGKYFLEIFSGNASKASGIKYLRNRYEFEEVICFGDNLNDVTMFEEADIKIAVGNAVPELKEMADFITSENDRDGVAEWLTENYGR